MIKTIDIRDIYISHSAKYLADNEIVFTIGDENIITIKYI